MTATWSMGLVEGTLASAVVGAAGRHLERPVLVLAVHHEGRVGYGECAALPNPLPGDPSIAEVVTALDGVHGRRLSAAGAAHGGCPPAWAVRQLFGTTALDHAVAHVVEMAVLDLELVRDGRTLSEWAKVDGADPAVAALVPIGPDDTPDTVAEAVALRLAAGCSTLRVKVRPGVDLAPATWVLAAAGTTPVTVDANGSYRLDGDDVDGPRALLALIDAGVGLIEQPLGANLLQDHATLRQRSGIRVALDESLRGPTALRKAMAYGALDVACIKPVRMGGLAAAVDALGIVASNGIDAFVGGFYETVWARRTLAVLARHRGVTLPSDLTAPSSYGLLDVGDWPVEGGRLSLAEGPGVAGISGSVLDRAVAAWWPVGDVGEGSVILGE